MSNSSISQLGRYFRQRFGIAIALLVLLLWSATWLCVSGSPSAYDGWYRLVLLVLLVTQFRVWDDLEDLPRDRTRFPQRVLVQSSSVVIFWTAVIVLCMTTMLVLAWHSTTTTVWRFVLLTAALQIWYQWLRSRFGNPYIHTALLLMKYPVFILLATGHLRSVNYGRLAAGMLGVYVVLWVYELATDHERFSTRSKSSIL